MKLQPNTEAGTSGGGGSRTPPPIIRLPSTHVVRTASENQLLEETILAEHRERIMSDRLVTGMRERDRRQHVAARSEETSTSSLRNHDWQDATTQLLPPPRQVQGGPPPAISAAAAAPFGNGSNNPRARHLEVLGEALRIVNAATLEELDATTRGEELDAEEEEGRRFASNAATATFVEDFGGTTFDERDNNDNVEEKGAPPPPPPPPAVADDDAIIAPPFNPPPRPFNPQQPPEQQDYNDDPFFSGERFSFSLEEEERTSTTMEESRRRAHLAEVLDRALRVDWSLGAASPSGAGGGEFFYSNNGFAAATAGVGPAALNPTHRCDRHGEPREDAYNAYYEAPPRFPLLPRAIAPATTPAPTAGPPFRHRLWPHAHNIMGDATRAAAGNNRNIMARYHYNNNTRGHNDEQEEEEEDTVFSMDL